MTQYRECDSSHSSYYYLCQILNLMENFTQKFYLILAFFTLSADLRNGAEVQAWTYHYSTEPSREWNSARQWCRQHYTDMVAIQNQKEIEYLNNILPRNPTYYWIGIRKLGDVWIWIGTNKTLTKECENWAAGEPNNGGRQEDCVEIYIKRESETAKWNNEKCSKKKGTLCYRASCDLGSCGARGECLETIGNYSCLCQPGFKGPRCEEAEECGTLEAPVQGSLQCLDMYGHFRFNSSCAFSCALGFKLTGTQCLHCQATGRWTSEPPSCQAVKCPDVLSAPKQGRMYCTDPFETHSFNSTCEFTCNEGFQLSGSSEILCDSGGMWTGTVPSCKVVECGAIMPPSQGRVICDDLHQTFSFGTSCHFSCEEGYSLDGDATVNCTSSGNWTAGVPACKVVKCHALVTPSHASLHCQHPVEDFGYSSTCWLGCEVGFDLIGQNSTYCTSLGSWSHNLPVCKARQCKILTAPPHGILTCSHPHGEFSFNSSCDVSCEEGFLINGTSTTRCNSMETWTETTAHCQVVKCDVPSIPHHASLHCQHPIEEFSYSSTCWLECDDGFMPKGANSTQCTAEGSWSHSLPLCEVVKCPVAGAPSHGSMHCQHPIEEFSYSSSCWMECEEGFILRGANSTQCTAEGTWSHTTPLCEAQRCASLSAPPHGNLTCSHPHGEFSFNSSCDVNCDEGFQLNGMATTRCSSLGKWTETTADCQVVKCPVAGAPSHGSMHCQHPIEEFSYSSSCWIECEEGFILRGANSTQCTAEGTWSHSTPLCEAQPCASLSAPPHGNLTCSHPHGEFSFNSSCDVSCDEGFQLNGMVTTRCSSLGKWTETTAHCQGDSLPYTTTASPLLTSYVTYNHLYIQLKKNTA
uniref:Selectin E n=1 Tax=Scleropages formosus TaxID=113540 RepID=A0A8C9RB51_SCLFO